MDIIIIAGIVVFFTQILKILLGISKRWIPRTALGVSLIIFGAFAFFTDTSFDWNTFSTAIVVGLTAIGLWSGFKSTKKKCPKTSLV